MDIAIIGAGPLGRALLDQLKAHPEVEDILFVTPGGTIGDVRIRGHRLVSLDSLLLGDHGPRQVVLALEDLEQRRKEATRLALADFPFLTFTREDALVQPGAVLCDGARIAPGARIGAHALCLPESIVGENARLGAYATLAERALVGTGATLGAGVYVGTGAIVAPGVTLGAGAFVAPGAVVIRDLPARAVAAGLPARVA